MRTRTVVALLCGAALVTTACAPLIFGGGAVAGAGIVAYAKGDVTRTLDAPLQDTHRAAEDALYELNYGITGRDQSETWTKIWALSPDDKRVTIQTESRGPGRTEVSVRAGYFGSQDVAMQVLEKIENRATYAAAPPTPEPTRGLGPAWVEAP